MGRKGQVEFIVILALIVVIAVVVVSQLNVFSPTETSDSRLARESVENMVRLGAYDTVDKMSQYGGYLSPEDMQGEYVYLNGKAVPYWQYGGQVSYPDKSSTFQEGMRRYIAENKGELESSLNNVTLGDPVVSPPVFQNDRIIVTVVMPTVIRDTPYNAPYVVEVPTRFSEVYEFSKAFATSESTQRPLEYFTLSTMFLSPLDENGFHEIPYAEMSLDCGGFLATNSYEVKPRVEKAITTTLSYTYMPGKVPLNNLRTTSHPKYSLTPINGNSYSNIDLNFELPDDFELLYGQDFQMDPDTISLTPEPIPFTGFCTSDPAYVNYYIRYPAIVRVNDPETGNNLQFAVDVYIKDNLPGAWNNLAGYESDEQKQVCDDSECYYNLSVTDLYGSPIAGATVRYMGCFLGRSDSDGNLRGIGPCGTGNLRVFANDYGEYKSSVSSDVLDNATVRLRKRVPLNFIFHEVVIDDQGQGNYMIQKGSINPIEESMAMMTFMSSRNRFEIYSDKAAATYDLLTEDNYSVSGTLVTSGETSVLKGAFIDEIEVNYIPGKEGQTVHVYIPSSNTFSGAADNSAAMEMAAIFTTVLQRCGIEPITTEEFVQDSACLVNVI